MLNDSMPWQTLRRAGSPPATAKASPNILSSLFSYLIVIPLDLVEPCYSGKNLPELLKRSGMYLERDAWEETLKMALCPSTRHSYGEALANARHLMYKCGTPAFDMQEVYRVVDWLQDIQGAVLETYRRLDGRPFEELLFFRLVMHDALYLRVYPAV